MLRSMDAGHIMAVGTIQLFLYAGKGIVNSNVAVERNAAQIHTYVHFINALCKRIWRNTSSKSSSPHLPSFLPPSLHISSHMLARSLSLSLSLALRRFCLMQLTSEKYATLHIEY